MLQSVQDNFLHFWRKYINCTCIFHCERNMKNDILFLFLFATFRKTATDRNRNKFFRLQLTRHCTDVVGVSEILFLLQLKIDAMRFFILYAQLKFVEFYCTLYNYNKSSYKSLSYFFYIFSFVLDGIIVEIEIRLRKHAA